MSNNNQCPQCHDYPEYRGACGVCGGTGTQPQSREQTKATVGDSTQNAVQPQESTKDPMPPEPKEAKHEHDATCISYCPDEDVEEAKPADTMRTWEDIKTSNDSIDRLAYFISNLSPHNLWRGVEALREALPNGYTPGGMSAPLPSSEATAVSPDTTTGVPPDARCCDNGYFWEQHKCLKQSGDTPSKSTDKEYNYYLGIDYALQYDPAFRLEYIRTHEAPTSSDGQGVSEDTMPLDEITSILIEYGEACYDHSGNTTHRRVAKERIQSLISSEKVKELRELLAQFEANKWGAPCRTLTKQRIEELESD